MKIESFKILKIHVSQIRNRPILVESSIFPLPSLPIEHSFFPTNISVSNKNPQRPSLQRKHHPHPNLASSSSTASSTTTRPPPPLCPVLRSYRLVRSSLTDFSLNGWFAERGWQRRPSRKTKRKREGTTFIPFFHSSPFNGFPCTPFSSDIRCSTRRAFF